VKRVVRAAQEGRYVAKEGISIEKKDKNKKSGKRSEKRGYSKTLSKRIRETARKRRKD